ncbi:MAG: hypothetical protein QXI16_05940 [Sulfolobaceae archaeon]
MREVEKLIFVYELTNLIKSKNIIFFPIMYTGLFLGAIGIFGAHAPFSFWFPLIYFFAAFGISGGLSRQITVSAPAIYYLSSYSKTKPYVLISIYLLVYIILVLFIFVADFALVSALYLVTSHSVVIGNALLLLLSAFLTSLFVNSLGMSIGLATARFNSSNIINALPFIPLILYMISLLLPANLQQYNPLTATFVMMSSSLTTEIIPTNKILLLALITMVTALALMAINILLTRKLGDVNLYDLFK